MKNKNLVLLIVCCLSLPLLATAKKANKTNKNPKAVAAKKAVVSGETDTSKPLFISKKRTIIKVALRANPSTGFSWFLDKYDHKFIQPLSVKYVPAATDLAGSAGLSIWKFKVKYSAFLVPQILQIKMVYMRPWSLQNVTHQVVTIVTRIDTKNKK